MNSIQEILGSVEKGAMFDSHFLIALMICEYWYYYINFGPEAAGKGEPTLNAHQRIGKAIKQFGHLVEKQPHESLSYNIHGNYSKCALWLKIG